LVVILAETVGLWFVINKLVIPSERKNVAYWVYQFSVVSFLFTLLTTPYMATIIAHEEMNIYAYVSILEVVLKLGIVFLLRFIPMDKLQLYGILMGIVTIINTTVYRSVCRKFKECKFYFYWNKNLAKEIMSYTGWNLFGTFTGIFRHQTVNILINQFFNPIVIASRSVAFLVNGAVTSFSQNLNTAIGPQITKNYASGKKEEMLSLVFQGAKGTYFVMYLFTLPLILEMPTVLTLWLKNPPTYSILFTRLALVEALIESISFPIISALLATGKIKLYTLVVGSIFLLNFPVSWIALALGAPAYSVLIITAVRLIIASLPKLAEA
jgi:O-antigen/teichoic acid export membrane protein